MEAWRAALVAGLTPDRFLALLPWQLGALLEAHAGRIALRHEIAYGAAWYAAVVGRARRLPSFDDAMAPFRKGRQAGPVEDDAAVQRAIEGMIARADAKVDADAKVAGEAG